MRIWWKLLNIYLVLTLGLNIAMGSCFVSQIDDQSLGLKEYYQIATLNSADDVQVVGNNAYVADFFTGVWIIDISDPANPIYKGRYFDGGEPHELVIDGNRAYVAEGKTGLVVIDITSSANPMKLGQFYDNSVAAPQIAIAISLDVVGNYAYVADGLDGLEIIDISDPANLTELGQFNDGGGANDVHVVGNFAYVADWALGLEIVNISDPMNPLEVNQYERPISHLHVSGDLAFVMGGHGAAGRLEILDISDPNNLTILGSYADSGPAKDVYIVGNRAYVADQTAGLKILDISDLTNPTELGHYNDGGEASSVCVVNDIAYVADWEDGLEIIDVSDPSNPVELGYYGGSVIPENTTTTTATIEPTHLSTPGWTALFFLSGFMILIILQRSKRKRK
ncbi:MAG: LVIVD repeat-containing protein [Candidatus Hodarchaeota archaeon]